MFLGLVNQLEWHDSLPAMISRFGVMNGLISCAQALHCSPHKLDYNCAIWAFKLLVIILLQCIGELWNMGVLYLKGFLMMTQILAVDWDTDFCKKLISFYCVNDRESYKNSFVYNVSIHKHPDCWAILLDFDDQFGWHHKSIRVSQHHKFSSCIYRNGIERVKQNLVLIDNPYVID